MNEIAINIIVACVSSILTAGILNIPSVARKIKADQNHPITKIRKIIFAIIRYAVIISLMWLLFSFANFDKVLIVLLSILLIILSYFIANDVLYFTFVNVGNLSTKDNLKEERDRLLGYLSANQVTDQMRKKYSDRIRDIDEILESKSYVNY